jgi:hypothetical protein
MPIERIRLSLLQNSLHSIHHAVEHLDSALSESDAEDAAAYDPLGGAVGTNTADGKQSWYVPDPYLKPPTAYQIKFAILHLIQGVELMVKAYLENQQPGTTIERGRSNRSITMRAAARALVAARPQLLDPDHLDLIMRTGDFRNQIEHAAFDMEWSAASRLALDFLSVANYLGYSLHGVRLAEVFDFDPYRNDGDPVGEAVGRLLSDRSEITEGLVERLAVEWAARSPSERLVRCLSCGAQGVSLSQDRCIACGTFGGAEIGTLMSELDDLVTMRQELLRRAGRVPPVG